MAACDGADRLQAEQCSLTARMSLVIPGQNRIDLARDSMDDTPWTHGVTSADSSGNGHRLNTSRPTTPQGAF